MYKLFKIPVTGIDGSEDIGINTSVRTTMGYNAANKTISVLIEKLIFPEVPTDRSVDLRGEHTEADFETLLERTFTTVDFPKTKDAVRWVVDYDVTKNELVGPFNALEYTKNFVTGSYTHREIPKIVKRRYNSNLIPLFAIENFYKSAVDFNASVMSVYVDEQGLPINDTILTGDLVAAELVDQAQATTWVAANVNANIHYEILADDGKVVGSTCKVSDAGMTLITAEALAANQVNIQNLGYDSESANVSTIGGNMFKVQLPVADNYDIRVIIGTELADTNLPISYDVTCVNGVSNKTRVTAVGRQSLETKQQFTEFLNQRVTTYSVNPQTGRRTVNGSIIGIEKIRISSNGLSAGDYIKLKLNAGDFYSYSELWIELI